MSEKNTPSVQNKTFSKVLKWGMIVCAIILLEGIAIATAVFVTESKNNENKKQLSNFYAQLSQYGSQINALEQISVSVAANSQQIAANSGVLNIVTENLNAIKTELGNNKFDVLEKQMIDLSHRMDSITERQNEESLVLSIALIIKENSLYKRNFSQEAEILADLSKNQEAIANDVQTVLNLKNVLIPSNSELISQYSKIAADFDFEREIAEEETAPKEDKRSAVARSIDLIKDTVAGINFDKVVVLKKDKKTNEEKLLLTTLTDLVEAHNFADALTFINETPQFADSDNTEFQSWQQQVQQKIDFDAAISHIIVTELKALRQDFKNTVHTNDTIISTEKN